MFACRVAWQRCGPLAMRIAFNLPRDGLQQRQMSSTPGGSGENIVYAVLCGGALVGAVSYAFNTVCTDSARFNDRISEINARPKKEWTPKPWPPTSAGGEEERVEEPNEEVAAEAAADSELETVVEEVVEIVVKGAEVVAEIAESVAAATQQVEVIEDEVVQVSEVVEETAHVIAEQVAEDPERNVMTASTKLEMNEVEEETVSAEIVDETAVKDDPLSSEVMELIETVPAMLDEEAAPSPVEAELAVEKSSTHTNAVPVVKDVQTPVEHVPLEALSVVEDASTFLEVAPMTEEASIHVKVTPAAEESITSEAFTLTVEESATSVQVVPAVGQSPSTQEPVVEEVLTRLVAEEAVVFAEAAPVVKETPTLVLLTQALEEKPILMKALPVSEEALVSVACFPTTENVLSPTVPVQMLREAPNIVEVPPVLEEALPPLNSQTVIEKTASVVEASPTTAQVSPLEAETAVKEIPPAKESDVDLDTSILEEAAPSREVALEKDPEQEYLVVVLEGALKGNKSSKVLGVAPMSGRIILAPEDEDKRHLQRIQMQ